MLVGTQVLGFAPFNMPPSAAFLEAIGMPFKPLAVIGHFAYGILWAVVLLAVFRHKTDVWRGIGLAVIVQWQVFAGRRLRARDKSLPLS